MILILIVVTFTSCSVSRKVERRGGYLLVKNTVMIDRPGITQADLLNFAQPKPNKKFLGLLRTRVWMWDAFAHKNDSRFSRWMVRNFAEPPVLLDTVLVHNSLIPMKQYLSNKGYFNSDMQSSYEIKKGRAYVTYNTITNPPFRFGTITRQINDDTLKRVILSEASLLKQGDQYDAYRMTAERDRLTQLARNSGYYAFTSDYIYYEVDTIGKNKEADIDIVIRNRSAGNPAGNGAPNNVTVNPNVDKRIADSLAANGLPHKRYVFNKIYINTDYPGINDTLRTFDTLLFYSESSRQANDKNQSGLGIIEGEAIDDSVATSYLIDVPDFYEVYRQRIRLRPAALARAVFVKPGEYYSQKNVNLTYNRIQNLGLSSYVSVNVVPARDTAILVPENEELLDCDVRIIRAKVNGFSIDPEVTNAGGLMGLGTSINFRNRNIFVGAESLRIKAFGAFEIKPSLSGEDEEQTHLGIFNSLETGFETGIDFPTLLSPFAIRNLDQNARPRTTLGGGFNYELRTQYERYLAKVSLSYEWNASPVSRHFFSPVDLSSISIVRDDLFTEKLLGMNNPRYFNQYSDHLILAMKYSYVFNNQNLSNRSNFMYFKINLEPAGNLFNLVSTVTAARRDVEGKYTLFNIRYAQYFRADWDFRYYKPINSSQRLVYRIALGAGIPYGNSISLPYEKGFFAGGANGMRGWSVRSLGPGEYKSENATLLESVGDLWAEGNIEYRFPLYRYLNGALFTDIGNIWLLEENEDFPGGNFTWPRAFKSLAANVGMGFRFDFSIFIFRIDGGLRMYDPAKEYDNRFFRPAKFQLRDINWNFGIGYPF